MGREGTTEQVGLDESMSVVRVTTKAPREHPGKRGRRFALTVPLAQQKRAIKAEADRPLAADEALTMQVDEIEPGKPLPPEVLAVKRFLSGRPTDRSECVNGIRPCPYVTCKQHLYLDVNPETGSIKLNFPDLDVWEMQETCTLDVADRGGITLEELGEILNLTRERIRQIEVKGLSKLRETATRLGMQDFLAFLDDQVDAYDGGHFPPSIKDGRTREGKEDDGD